MDPAKFGVSTIPLNHTYYGPISPEKLSGKNSGKIAVVTGAGRGIGRAIAVALANSGANLAILDLGSQDQSETKAACQEKNVKVIAYGCDVTDEAEVQRTFAQIQQDLGPVDILVNNAGKFLGRPVSMTTFSNFWKTVETNFKSTMLCTFEVLPGMRERKSGSIINIASRSATVDTPLGMGYNCAKAAVVRATSNLQLELDDDGVGEHIQVYALHPGGVLTAMGAAAHDPEVVAKYPALQGQKSEIEKLFKDGPELCGATCAYLASGQAKAIRGLYFDCRQDIERVCGAGRSTLEANDLYNLKVEFLQGYRNEP